MSADNHQSPGTAPPAHLKKAACGIRFEDDELQEGIDFSGAADLKPDADTLPDQEASPTNQHGQPHRHP